MKKRLFIAVNIPLELKEKIFSTLSKKIQKKEIKIVKQENLHITLKFLGYLKEEVLRELKSKLGELFFKKFEVVCNGVGEFNGRVIWIDLADEQKNLEKISIQLNNILGLEAERFRAHITIARNKKMPKSEVKKIVEKLNQKKFCEKFLVKSIDLMESKLTPGGPEYSKLL